MEDRTSDRAATRPESANPEDQDQIEQTRPVLRLLSPEQGGESAKGTAEDKAAMEMYAAMLPRAHILGRINQRHLMIAGGVVLLLLGISLARHMPASNAATPPVQSSPIPAPAAAAPPAAEPAGPAIAAPAAVPEPASKPEPVAVPSTEAAVALNVEDCRQALKKRDSKLVSVNCESVLAADPSLAKPLLAFAKAQFEKGKSAQAAIWARKIVQVNGSLADAYLIIGATEQEARHPAAAKTAYQRYLELAPKGPYAEDVRSSLASL